MSINAESEQALIPTLDQCRCGLRIESAAGTENKTQIPRSIGAVRPYMSVKNTNGIARTQAALNASFTMGTFLDRTV